MEPLLNNLIKATGWSILHSLWQGALIYALLLPSQMSILKLKAKIKYAFAYGANCLMLICFLFTFISVFQWPANQDLAAAYNPVIPAAVYAAKISLSQYAEMAFPVLVLLYAFGLFIQSYLVYKGYKKIQVLKNAVHVNVSEEWFALFIKLTNKLKIRKHIVFKLSEHVQVPLVVGYMKPVILFPLALALQMDIKQVEAILIHELSHVRRDDYMLNLVKTMIDTILFFNPFMWLMGRFINIEREHACDDLVVSMTKTPLTYAHALLKLELLAAENANPALAMAATGNNQQLYQRIKRITDMKTNYMNAKQKLFAITLTIATIISLAWISPSKTEKQQKGLNKPVNKIEKLLLSAPIDTTKKKAKKIIMINGVRYEPAKDIKIIDNANGITQVYLNNIKGINGALNIRLDTLSDHLASTVSDLSAEVNKLVFASVSNQKELDAVNNSIQIKGLALQKEFNSPEQQAKLQKYFAAGISDTITNHIYRNMNKAYALVPGRNLEGVVLQQKLTAKQKEQVNKIMENATEEIKEAQLAAIQSKAFKIRVDGKDLSTVELNEIAAQNSPNGKLFRGMIATEEVRQTPEYIELKKKFDKDVQELVSKKLKKNK